MSRLTSHVASDRLGEAARHASLDFLRDAERLHVESCERCRGLFGGYRLTDRLLAAPWREVKVPAVALEPLSRRAALAGRLGGFTAGLGARSLAPLVAVAAVLLLVGAAVALPMLIPTPAASAAASPSETPTSAQGTQAWPSGSAAVDATPVARASGSAGKAPSPPPQPTPAPTPVASPLPLALDTTRIGGDPLAWAPNGDRLLVWSNGKVQVRDDHGRLGASVSADAATWFDSSTFAVAARSSGWRGDGSETVKVMDAGGRVVVSVPGTYNMGGNAFALLLGSGSGELTIASGPGGSGGPGCQFVLWNGHLSDSHDGLPVAFSRDGRKLAVLHPGSVSGGSVSGWLEIVSVPSLDTVSEFRNLNLLVGPGALGSRLGLDAAFSPDGRYLLASGTLVDASRGSSTAAGKGGWLSDGTLITASPDGLLRWPNGRPTLDPRFPGVGTVEASRHGELIYFYGDGRPPLYLAGNGTPYALSLNGIRSIDRLLIAPDGRTIALDGRATDGSSIAAVASLTGGNQGP